MQTQPEDWRREKEASNDVNIVITNIDETRQQCNQQGRKQQTQVAEEIEKEDRKEKGKEEKKKTREGYGQHKTRGKRSKS